MYQASILPRAKRQRFDKRMLGFTFAGEGNSVIDADCMDSDVKTVGTFKVVGEKPGFDAYRAPVIWEYIEVTLDSGWIVPAYRIKSEAGNYAICQNFAFRAIRAS